MNHIPANQTPPRWSVLLVLASLASVSSAQQTLCSRPLPDWQAGVEGGIPVIAAQTSITAFGAIANDGIDDASALQQAINSINGSGAVLIPSGNWNLASSISIPSGVILRGEGASSRLLINHNDHAFRITGSGTGTSAVTASKGYTQVLSGADKGSRVITVDNPSAFAAGDGIELVQSHNSNLHDTDPAWSQSWAGRLIGMFNQVEAVNGNQLTLVDPLAIDMDENLGVWAPAVTYVSQAGLEDLDIERQDSSDTHLIYVQYASNVWFSNVTTHMAAKSHYYLSQSRHLEVRDSWLDDASQHGSGGHGYGVELLQRTSNSLVINSVFDHLRHSFVLHLGANSNVIAYNYSNDPYQDDGTNWLPADLSLHGHYAYANLIESNRLVSVAVSDYWGPTGPDNLLLRNRIETEGIAAYDHSDGQLALGNRLQTAGIHLDTTIDPGSWIRHGNFDTSTASTDQDSACNNIPASGWLTAAPALMDGYDWPAMGSDVAIEKLPAEDRFMQAGNNSNGEGSGGGTDSGSGSNSSGGTQAPLLCSASAGSNWSSGNNVDVTLTNLSTTVVNGWQVELPFPDGSSIVKLWSANWVAGTPDSASNLSWNGVLQPGQSVTFGLKVSKAVAGSAAVLPTVRGSLCQ